ncbi:tripartite motif-containing protein 66 isoform X2 [Neopsephotus bourkii]|uniref:tripartite motif-containing protein 66 isoform X2 n=1 Tax=Neopsephotus bourkii TaxID=309878 RepID=UPI002AA592BD|nr:tripartite motif-containing protein 66 isoform X2 [Neopsephotus bourkii]
METLGLLRNCLVCKWDLRSRDPRMPPCLHSFCKVCLLDLIQGYSCIPTDYEVWYEGTLSCPVCKQTCFARDVVENFFLKDFPTANSDMAKSCSTCKEKRPAHSLCTSCNKWLCSSCTEEHRHSKETGDRFLSVSLKGCTVHTQEPLKVFCETCDTLTCRNCLLTEHKEHRFRHLDEALQNQRVILENVITKVEEKKNAIQVSAKQIEDRLLEVKHLYKKVENQIKTAKMVLMNEINKRTTNLLEQLESITSERKQKLEQQLQGVVLLSRQVEHVQNFISWAVCSKDSIPFLFSKDLVVFQIPRLLETNCNTDPPLKIRFTWDSSYWTKQLSNFGGFTMEGGDISHSDVLLCGNVHALQTSLYHGHCAPGSQLEPVNSQPHQFPPAIQCPTSVCCPHCLSIPHPNKALPSYQDINCHQNFRQPPELHQQHFPLQYSMQQHDKEPRGAPQPMKLTQSGLEQQSRSEQENMSGRMRKHLPSQQLQQTAPMGYAVVSHEAQQVHKSHSQPCCAQASLQSSSEPVQLGHLQKIKSNHLQQSPQQQQQQLPPASPPSGQNENTHKQVIQQSLEIMHHQFELEEMKKDLELLLQAQGQPSLQLNQAKPPQHVQQTIVGQINYIVRQPAPVQQQIQEEAQVCESSTELDAQKPVIPLDKSDSPSLSESLEEASVSSHSPETTLQQSSFHPVRKHLASLSVVGFSNGLEMELPSVRLSSSADTHMQAAAAETLCPSPRALCDCDTPPESVPSYTLVLDRAPSDLSPGAAAGHAPGDALQGSTKCKLEYEDFNIVDHPLENNLDAAGQDVVNELTLSTQKVLEEPINLSIKKCQHYTSSSELHSNTSFLPMNARKRELRIKEDSNNCEKEHFEMGMKSDQNVRPSSKEQKNPYVRLERLKICTSQVGELPVFKLQPKDNEQEGDFLLIVECGTQSSSMAIKINKHSPPEEMKSKENSDHRKFLIPQDAGQIQLPSVDTPSVDQKVSNGISTTKKSPITQEVNTIENEDFCAVCLNGGELLCCDRCPKVFHLSCHVPALLSFPVGEWVCTLCRNPVEPEVEYDCENTRYSHSNNTQYGLDDYDQKKCEKLVLSLFCSSMSLPFHEPVSPLARHYYQIIKRPMDLSVIRNKLQKKDKSHYSAPEELVTDVRLMFWNCAKFNYPDSEVAEAGRRLNVFFEGKVKEVYPDRHFPSVQQEDSDSEEVESQNSKTPPQDFQWPSYGQECIQPKRRRRHAVRLQKQKHLVAKWPPS